MSVSTLYVPDWAALNRLADYWLALPADEHWLKTSLETSMDLRSVDSGMLAKCKLCGRGAQIKIDIVRGGSWTGPGGSFVNHSDIRRVSKVIVRGRDRPIHVDWLRQIRDEIAGQNHCTFIFESWGEWQLGSRPGFESIVVLNDGSRWDHERLQKIPAWYSQRWNQMNPQPYARVGRELSGRELDGKTHEDKETLSAD